MWEWQMDSTLENTSYLYLCSAPAIYIYIENNGVGPKSEVLLLLFGIRELFKKDYTSGSYGVKNNKLIFIFF